MIFSSVCFEDKTIVTVHLFDCTSNSIVRAGLMNLLFPVSANCPIDLYTPAQLKNYEKNTV